MLEAGGELCSELRDVVTIPRGVVEEAIRRIPRNHRRYARDPGNDIQFDRESLFTGSCSGKPEVLDLETGMPRNATYEDVAQMTRLMDALENFHAVSCIASVTDVTPELMIARTVDAMIRNTSKTLSGYALNTETVNVLARMFACVAGGPDELRDRPLFAVHISPTSPLTFDSHVCDVMTRSAHHGFPVDIVPCPVCGGTSPATLAGS